jgi:hypothetical protein
MIFHIGHREAKTSYCESCAWTCDASCRANTIREGAEFRATAMHGWRTV